MKSILFGLLFLGLSIQIHSQANDNAIVKNTKYLETVNLINSPVIVKKMENIVANYDITKADIYKSKNKGTYDVTFKETKGKITATYSKSGELIKTIEEYTNLKLPLQVSKSISKTYPGWIFTGNSHHIEYNKGKLKKLYRIKIKKGASSKELKFELQKGVEANYVAVN